MGRVLERIVAETRGRLPALRRGFRSLEAAAARRPDPPSFLEALRPGQQLRLIAEVKRRSPSAGEIAPELDPVEHALSYAAEGAAAVSVLTEPSFFGGSLEDVEKVTSRVAIPVLRKDFILDEVQLVEARAAGASAVLLIVRILSAAELRRLLAAASGLRLGALVEAHDAGEVDAAAEAGAAVIGINSRDLDDFTIDRGAAWELLRRVPPDRVAVAESGIAAVADAESAAAAGADAVLVGTALSKAPDPRRLVAALAGVGRRGR